VTPGLDSAEDLETTTKPDAINNSEQPAIPKSSDSAERSADNSAEVAAGDPPRAPTPDLAAAVRELASSADRFHDRSEQREGVIDYLRSELEVLRRGERRGLLRPLLADMCRLRNDLLRQAARLPADYDAERAAGLLMSYAESIQLTLESNGVVTYVPDEGDSFDPRKHRKVKNEDSADPTMTGRIARVERDGYLDIEANSPITPAEVVIFAARKEAQ
jgi:molecular chaperone GrpE (heat shock protein)